MDSRATSPVDVSGALRKRTRPPVTPATSRRQRAPAESAAAREPASVPERARAADDGLDASFDSLAGEDAAREGAVVRRRPARVPDRAVAAPTAIRSPPAKVSRASRTPPDDVPPSERLESSSSFRRAAAELHLAAPDPLAASASSTTATASSRPSRRVASSTTAASTQAPNASHGDAGSRKPAVPSRYVFRRPSKADVPETAVESAVSSATSSSSSSSTAASSARRKRALGEESEGHASGTLMTSSSTTAAGSARASAARSRPATATRSSAGSTTVPPPLSRSTRPLSATTAMAKSSTGRASATSTATTSTSDAAKGKVTPSAPSHPSAPTSQREKHVLLLVTAAVREAKLAQSSGDVSAAREVYVDLADRVADVRRKAVFWLAWSRLEESAGFLREARALLDQGAEACRADAWEFDCITQAMRAAETRLDASSAPESSTSSSSSSASSSSLSSSSSSLSASSPAVRRPTLTPDRRRELAAFVSPDSSPDLATDREETSSRRPRHPTSAAATAATTATTMTATDVVLLADAATSRAPAPVDAWMRNPSPLTVPSSRTPTKSPLLTGRGAVSVSADGTMTSVESPPAEDAPEMPVPASASSSTSTSTSTSSSSSSSSSVAMAAPVTTVSSAFTARSLLPRHHHHESVLPGSDADCNGGSQRTADGDADGEDDDNDDGSLDGIVSPSLASLAHPTLTDFPVVVSPTLTATTLLATSASKRKAGEANAEAAGITAVIPATDLRNASGARPASTSPLGLSGGRASVRRSLCTTPPLVSPSPVGVGESTTSPSASTVASASASAQSRPSSPRLPTMVGGSFASLSSSTTVSSSSVVMTSSTGSVLVLQAIPARPATARALGSDVILSPVRRSWRILAEHAPAPAFASAPAPVPTNAGSIPASSTSSSASISSSSTSSSSSSSTFASAASSASSPFRPSHGGASVEGASPAAAASSTPPAFRPATLADTNFAFAPNPAVLARHEPILGMPTHAFRLATASTGASSTSQAASLSSAAAAPSLSSSPTASSPAVPFAPVSPGRAVGALLASSMRARMAGVASPGVGVAGSMTTQGTGIAAFGSPRVRVTRRPVHLTPAERVPLSSPLAFAAHSPSTNLVAANDAAESTASPRGEEVAPATLCAALPNSTPTAASLLDASGHPEVTDAAAAASVRSRPASLSASRLSARRPPISPAVASLLRGSDSASSPSRSCGDGRRGDEESDGRAPQVSSTAQVLRDLVAETVSRTLSGVFDDVLEENEAAGEPLASIASTSENDARGAEAVSVTTASKPAVTPARRAARADASPRSVRGSVSRSSRRTRTSAVAAHDDGEEEATGRL